MVDKQDGQQHPSGDSSGDDQPPAKTQSSGGSDPAAFLTEGWGGGDATVDDVLENARTLVDRLRGPILYAWLMVAAGVLAFDLVEAILNSIHYLVGSSIIQLVVTLAWIPVVLIAMVAYPFLTITQFSLFKPLRKRVVEGPVQPDSIKQVFSEAKDCWVSVAITAIFTWAAVGIGLVMCILPGLFAAFLLWMAVYLAATRDDMSPIDAMKRSAELAKKYWKLILIAFGAMFVGGICFGMIYGAFSVMLSIIGVHTGAVFFLGQAVFMWTGYAVWMFLAFVAMSAVYITVDVTERNEGAAEGADGADVAW